MSRKAHTHGTDICIAGAGIVGLSIALELRARGLSVVVVEAAEPLREASTAAAGMLAADDPHNPAELSALSHLSLALYPGYLERLAQVSGTAVPFQTTHTIQATGNVASDDETLLSGWLQDLACTHTPVDGAGVPSGFRVLPEHSIDPRQLAASLLAAVAADHVDVFAGERVVATQTSSGCVQISTPTRTLEAAHFIDCTGAWANDAAYRIIPVKGQMLAVALPPGLPLQMTVRTGEIYIVPRTAGPDTGRAIIGATVEDVGFDKTVHPSQIAALHRKASILLPHLADAGVLESWAGLRPATPDRLPLLGAHPVRPRHWVATGHYRNGILLAPATAHIVAELILDEAPSVPIESFSPVRASLRRTL